MKNLVLALLITTAIVALCGMQNPPEVTSISFDGGKTRLTGNVMIEINEWSGGLSYPLAAKIKQTPEGNVVVFDIGQPVLRFTQPTSMQPTTGNK